MSAGQRALRTPRQGARASAHVAQSPFTPATFHGLTAMVRNRTRLPKPFRVTVIVTEHTGCLPPSKVVIADYRLLPNK